jgi:NAD(P)-dependent dehydrogenase (short-subunit alcohol dehydrogenase family)
VAAVDRAATPVEPAGGDVLALGADVSDADDVARVVTTVLDAYGRIDVLCNNAGIGSTADVVSCTPEEWDRVFAVNARGVFLGIRAVVPTMLAQRSGVIINTSSVAAQAGLRDRAAYCASKGAVSALTRQVAVQYAGTGVRCNSIAPGTTDSPWVGRLLAQAGDPEEERRRLVARQPMGRLADPAEIAAAAVWLASDDAAFVTGVELAVDGGLLAG